MAQPPRRRGANALNMRKMKPRFFGGYAHVCLENEAQCALILNNAPVGHQSACMLAFFDHIKEKMPADELTQFNAWSGELYYKEKKAGCQPDALGFCCFRQALPDGKPDPAGKVAIVMCSGPTENVEKAASHCAHFFNTGEILLKVDFINNKILDVKQDGKLKPRFIGFPYVSGPVGHFDRLFKSKQQTMLEAKTPNGVAQFFHDIEDLLPADELEPFRAWFKFTTSRERETSEASVLFGFRGQDCLLCSIADNDTIKSYVDQVKTHIAAALPKHRLADICYDEPRFIGFPFYVFPNSKIFEENQDLITRCLTGTGGVRKFLSRVEHCMLPGEQKLLHDWMERVIAENEPVVMNIVRCEGKYIMLTYVGTEADMQQHTDKILAEFAV